MNLPESSQFTLIPTRTLDQLLAALDDIRSIKLKLDDQATGPEVEWIPRRKFMELACIGSTKFNILKNEGRLILKDVGRKKFVHVSCLDKYFHNQL